MCSVLALACRYSRTEPRRTTVVKVYRVCSGGRVSMWCSQVCHRDLETTQKVPSMRSGGINPCTRTAGTSAPKDQSVSGVVPRTRASDPNTAKTAYTSNSVTFFGSQKTLGQSDTQTDEQTYARTSTQMSTSTHTGIDTREHTKTHTHTSQQAE